jgi:hypothetical protein
VTSAPASEVQKNFGEWHDRAYEGPVEITRYGRTTAYLVSAKLFQEMWASYRKVVSIEDLSEDEVAMIRASRVETDQPFTLDDLPDEDESPTPGKVR